MKGKSGRNQLCLLERFNNLFLFIRNRFHNLALNEGVFQLKLFYVEKFNQNNMGL